MNGPQQAIRLDLWLWAARFFRTRSLARQAIEGGKVEVDGSVAKPAKLVHVGHVLRVTRGGERFELQILAVSLQRGPARIAETLYAETAASASERERLRKLRRLTGERYTHPPGRPDKHSRKLLRGLKEGRPPSGND